VESFTFEQEAYDKAKWHYGGDFPEELDDIQGFVHTGMFFGWLLERNLVAEWTIREIEGVVEDFRAGRATGVDLYESFDGCLFPEMLTDEGRAFADAYYRPEQFFLGDYEAVLGGDLPTLYHVLDTRENYELLRDRLDLRFIQWRRGHLRTAFDPWWEAFLHEPIGWRLFQEHRALHRLRNPSRNKRP
jgi:hypothetical protein